MKIALHYRGSLFHSKHTPYAGWLPDGFQPDFCRPLANLWPGSGRYPANFWQKSRRRPADFSQIPDSICEYLARKLSVEIIWQEPLWRECSQQETLWSSNFRQDSTGHIKSHQPDEAQHRCTNQKLVHVPCSFFIPHLSFLFPISAPGLTLSPREREAGFKKKLVHVRCRFLRLLLCYCVASKFLSAHT